MFEAFIYTNYVFIFYLNCDVSNLCICRYQKLSNDYRDRDHKWNHSEELELLKGYQAFGERWPLIRVFYLPHRRSPQIRAKLVFFQSDYCFIFILNMHLFSPINCVVMFINVSLSMCIISGGFHCRKCGKRHFKAKTTRAEQ